MRRTFSLLLMLCWAWSRALAPGCAMQPAALTAPGTEHAAHAGHGMPAHGHPSPDGGPAHHAAPCALAFACGGDALAQGPWAVASPTLQVRPAAWPAGAPYLSPARSTETPPPRSRA
jgi:hypothetical protein